MKILLLGRREAIECEPDDSVESVMAQVIAPYENIEFDERASIAVSHEREGGTEIRFHHPWCRGTAPSDLRLDEETGHHATYFRRVDPWDTCETWDADKTIEAPEGFEVISPWCDMLLKLDECHGPQTRWGREDEPELIIRYDSTRAAADARTDGFVSPWAFHEEDVKVLATLGAPCIEGKALADLGDTWRPVRNRRYRERLRYHSRAGLLEGLSWAQGQTLQHNGLVEGGELGDIRVAQ